ncbi:hypothetical protein EPA93_26170 [Ktedonosporobacter rubrisoli]|uniref:Copper resistance protein CopC n=1 Tax=Ktedonosporobacter rubrisoli TaxID=2509675 RepID=A0A4P6JV92_KTERU|nr:copper resistance protein CopC [Ktedonosporobacter rubrisoli]QBD79283.1 hypothetical protein EPA93_26170 [Ktedonosporobacter rubrisoli]
MASRLSLKYGQRLLFALLLALVLFVLFPSISEAHAVLLRSDPAQGAVLSAAPTQVRMWFSEDLNPTFSTAAVVNAANQRVDSGNAHVTGTDPREMDVSLQANLPPAVYIVAWRSQSADDGHILKGSFTFSVARPDGTVPQLSGNTQSGQNLQGGNTTDLVSGQLDAGTLLSFIMITLADLGIVFWVGAQLWHTFVQQVSEAGDAEQKALEQQAEERFARYLAIPTLIVLLLANLGILLGQALTITAGQAGQLPATLVKLAANGHFGTFWSMREIVIVLAIILAVFSLLNKRRSENLKGLLSWGNLLLALALLIATSLSGHAAAVNSDLLIFAVLADWLHLLAASLWIGGMLYLSLAYLPVLKRCTPIERARALLAILPGFTPLAVAGIVIMAATGPFNATVHMTSWEQLLNTPYGRTLDLKVLLVVILLLVSAFHLWILRPRLRNDYKKYVEAHNLLQASTETEQEPLDEKRSQPKAQVRWLEATVSRQGATLSRVLRWEPLLGVAVLVCTGLLSVFAGTLQPALPQGAPSGAPAPTRPFITNVKTSDNKFTVQLNVTPNRFGSNVFTVTVLDSSNKPATNVGVVIDTSMLDMDMGTDTIDLQPDGKGHFSASGNLSMGGHWQLRIQVRTPDNTLHEARVKMFTPF